MRGLGNIIRYFKGISFIIFGHSDQEIFAVFTLPYMVLSHLTCGIVVEIDLAEAKHGSI
jgi:hypothetical protein